MSKKQDITIFESIFNHALIGIGLINNNGYFLQANQALCEHLNRGANVRTKYFSEIVDDENRQKIDHLFSLIDKGHCSLIKDVLAVEIEENKHLLIETSLSPFECIEIQTDLFLLFTEDITNQKDTHAALLQSEKLALTGQLAASLAHEINNPLQTSIGCLGLAEEILDEDDEALRVYLQMALEELQRSARIVKKLRDLNRKTDYTERQRVNLKKIVDGVLILTKNRMSDRNILPFFIYQGPAPNVLASRDQIQQLVLNLVINAIDAQPNGGHIILEILHTKDPEGFQLDIRDRGEGIEPEMMSHLFDPFFTSKEDGLGLGLYICKQIVDDHNGSIKAESKPGHGTVFSIWLPGIPS